MKSCAIAGENRFLDWLNYGIVRLMSNAGQTKTFSNGDEKLDRIIEMLRDLTLRVESVETKLEALETKVDERIKDTRPLWEGVDARLTAIKEGQGRVEQKLAIVDRKIDLLNKELFEMRTEHSLLQDRVDKLERQPS